MIEGVLKLTRFNIPSFFAIFATELLQSLIE